MKVSKRSGSGQFRPTDGFIMKLQKKIKEIVIPYQYDVMCDRLENVEKSHVVSNFVNAAKALRGEDTGDGFYGQVFQDSDAAKWLEAVAYSLEIFPDKELENKADELIELIASAQDSDGYLDTYFTIKNREKRWTDLLEGHELYCAGHMMEAAVAYYQATGKRRFLDVMEKNAEHIYKHFIVEGNGGYPGHPEIELALLKMYRATGNKMHLELAKHFIDTRGTDDFFAAEAEKRNWAVWGNDPNNGEYQQSHKPVREQSDAVGHSVRAVYLYTAMADLASETDDTELFQACKNLWSSITQKRMYVTGGIGSTVIGEAFTVDNDLPNDTAYCETCASIGLMMFASRMSEAEIKGEYADILERAFYNTVLAGMQLDGKRFFYVNPLEVIPGISGVAATHWHNRPQRPEWFACACCPPNAARLISSIGRYAYGESDDTVYCHMFISGEVDLEKLSFSCETEYPYGFDVKYKISSGNGNMAVHIPEWSEEFSALLNGKRAEFTLKDGYARFFSVKSGDVLEIHLDPRPKFVYPSCSVPETTGCVALQRGPLIYCFEEIDNGDILSLSIDDSYPAEAGEFDPQFLDGTTVITVNGHRQQTTSGLYSFDKPSALKCKLKAVPYYTWGNRGENQMRVWMTRSSL